MEPNSQANPNGAPDLGKPTPAKPNHSKTEPTSHSPSDNLTSNSPANFWQRSSLTSKVILSVALMIIFATILYLLFSSPTKTSNTAANSPKTQVSPSIKVTISSAGFVPHAVTIKAGSQITWKNTDSKPHQVAADPYPKNDSIPGFDSTKILQTGDGYSFTFSKTGTYHVHDQLKPLKITGTVKVE
jgi:plastocyanin